MFEFIYYVSVIWQVKLDFDGGLSYWVKNEMGQNWQIPINVWSIFEIIHDMWKRPNIFMWLSFREGYKGTSANEKIEFKSLETSELSSLWFIHNLSQWDV